MTFAATTREGKIEWKIEIFHSQASDKHNESISCRKSGGNCGRGGRAGPAHTGGKCAKIHCAEKVFSFFFSLCLPSNEGKGKKNFHLPDGCCFLLLRRVVQRGGQRWGAVCSWAWQ